MKLLLISVMIASSILAVSFVGGNTLSCQGADHGPRLGSSFLLYGCP